MTIRWILCGSENLHILGTCPNCYATESGLLMGTTVTGYAGRITATCVDCGKSVDYCVDAAVQKVWNMNPVESKTTHLERRLAEQAESNTVGEKRVIAQRPSGSELVTHQKRVERLGVDALRFYKALLSLGP